MSTGPRYGSLCLNPTFEGLRKYRDKSRGVVVVAAGPENLRAPFGRARCASEDENGYSSHRGVRMTKGISMEERLRKYQDNVWMRRAHREVVAEGPENFWAIWKGDERLGRTGYSGHWGIMMRGGRYRRKKGLKHVSKNVRVKFE
jgi:hypothetical protein